MVDGALHETNEDRRFRQLLGLAIIKERLGKSTPSPNPEDSKKPAVDSLAVEPIITAERRTHAGVHPPAKVTVHDLRQRRPRMIDPTAAAAGTPTTATSGMSYDGRALRQQSSSIMARLAAMFSGDDPSTSAGCGVSPFPLAKTTVAASQVSRITGWSPAYERRCWFALSSS